MVMEVHQSAYRRNPSVLPLQTYPEEPYYKGRWSNGPTWIEIAASMLAVPLTDYGLTSFVTFSFRYFFCLQAAWGEQALMRGCHSYCESYCYCRCGRCHNRERSCS